MHCPNCGTQAAAEQRFCRSCGLELQVFQQALAQQLTAPGTSPRQTPPAARFAWLLFSGIALMFTGAGLLALEKRLGLNSAVGLLGLLLTIGGPLLALLAVLSPMLFARSARAARLPLPQSPAVLPAAETTSKLGPAVAVTTEPGASVIEHTTRSLVTVTADHQEAE